MRTLSFVLLLVALVASGCKKDDAPTAPPAAAVIPADLAGTWTAQSVTLAGQPKTLAEAFSLVPNATSVTVTFTSQGAFSFKHVDANKTPLTSLDGTVTIDGSYMTCTVMYAGQTITLINGPWELSGGQLTITSYVTSLGGNAKVIYTK